MRLRFVHGAVLAVAALLLLLRLGAAPLIDPDESRFACTSVEMLASGDPVVPTFGGEPRLAKPPLLHWLQSSLFSVLGAGEGTVRLPSALSTLASIALVGWIGRRRFGDEGGIWAAAMLSTMPLVLALGRVGTLDALLAVHVLAVVALDLAAPREGSRYLAPCLGALLGLAFLVKGPVGVVLPLVILLAGRAASGMAVVPRIGPVLTAVATFAMVTLPWTLALLARVGLEALIETLRLEVVERVVEGTLHVEPPWYYAGVAPVAFLPWIAPTVAGMVRAWGRRHEPASRTALYVSAGLLAGLLFFSLSKGKLPSYILPLAPLVALLATWELARELEDARHGVVSHLLSATLLATGLVLALAGLTRLSALQREVALIGAALYAIAALVAGAAAFRGRTRLAYGVAALVGAAFLFVVVVRLLPSFAAERSSARLIEQVPVLRSNRPLVTVEIRVPSLTYYLRRVPEVIELDDLESRLALPDAPLLVFADVDLPSVPLPTLDRLRQVGREGKFFVFEEKPQEADDRSVRAHPRDGLTPRADAG